MNYFQIVLKGYLLYKNQQSSCLSYFKSEAQKAYRDSFVEYSDFFDSCTRVLSQYKNEIVRKHMNDIYEFEGPLRSYRQQIAKGNLRDKNNRLYQDEIDCILKEQEKIKKRGYNSLTCGLKEDGEITRNMFEIKHELPYVLIEVIEKAILKASESLSIKQSDNTNIEKGEDDNCFKYNEDIINEIYNYCCDTNTFKENEITHLDFVEAVAKADFKKIIDICTKNHKKTRAKYIIHALKEFIFKEGEKWCIQAANGINTEPTKLSGLNVPIRWKKDLLAIK